MRHAIYPISNKFFLGTVEDGSRLFTEDDLLRQHHICFSEESYDPTAQQVMDSVKLALMDLRKAGEISKLDDFIITYVNSLLQYVRSFKTVVSKTDVRERYFKIFSNY